MATSTTVVVIGLPEAEAKLAGIGILLAKAMPIVLAAGALPVMNKAKELAPYRTGNLQRSIHIETVGPTEVTVGTDVMYAAAQEYGRPEINLPERPYLRPAMDTSTALVTSSMQKALSALLAVGP